VIDVLVAAVAVTAVVAAGLALLAAVTLVPFVLALRMADRRGFPSARWGSLALAGAVLGLGVVLLALRSDASPLLAAVGLPMSFAAPLALSLLEPGQPLGGRTGRHA
jgi:hypothetical protein